jgi:hypothetical protein
VDGSAKYRRDDQEFYLQSVNLDTLVNIIEVLGNNDVGDFLVPKDTAETRRSRTIS